MLERFKARRAMVIYASILTGKPIACSKGIVTVEYDEQFKFNKERLDKQEFKTVVNEVFSEVFNDNIKVNFVVRTSENNEQNVEDVLKSSLGDDLFEVIDE